MDTFFARIWKTLRTPLIGVSAIALLPAGAHAACQLNSASSPVKHVVYIEFDNVHFTRDNPNVPSDLEQMPNLLKFITQNGTLDAGDHTVLISHTANDILTTETGLYSDDDGIFIANSFGVFEPEPSTFIDFPSSFFYWTDSVEDINSFTDDNTFALTTPAGNNVPAPWVPFTRAGCDVGAFSTANIVLERTPFDVDQVFGAGSSQGTEDDPKCHSAHPSCPKETNDFIGAAIHCAIGSPFCTPANTAVPDKLPDEPGGYMNYQALFGLKYIAPALGGLTDYNGNAITGFSAINFDPVPAQTLAVVETMLKKGIPVVFAYIADAHDNQEGAGLSAEPTFGPGEAPYVKQLHDYDTAFGKFFADLKSAGIDQSNTLFVFTPDEGDHFVGGAPSPANCDGAKIVNGTVTPDVACTYPANPISGAIGVGELDLNLNGVVAAADPSLPGFSIHFDDAATVYVPGQPAPTDPSVRALEETMASLSVTNPHNELSESLLGTGDGPELQGALVDPVAQKLLHMNTVADPAREPTFTFFGSPDFFFVTGGSTAPVVFPNNAWNHGDIQPEIARTFIGIAGPNVRNLGVTNSFFSDHVDVRPTIMYLSGLTDDYPHDGRVLMEVVAPNALNSNLHAHHDTLLNLGQALKQIDAPFGQLAESTLTVSTFALLSSSAGDTTYNQLEAQIAAWTVTRDNLATQMKALLEGAEFGGQSINEKKAKSLIAQANSLLNQAASVAASL